MSLPYLEDLEGDRAVVGDVGFGPLDEVRQLDGRRGMGVIDLANRWTGGIVPSRLLNRHFVPSSTA